MRKRLRRNAYAYAYAYDRANFMRDAPSTRRCLAYDSLASRRPEPAPSIDHRHRDHHRLAAELLR